MPWSDPQPAVTDRITTFAELVGRENVIAVPTAAWAAASIRWMEAIAVGNSNFSEKLKSELGFKAAHREVTIPSGCNFLSGWFNDVSEIE